MTAQSEAVTVSLVHAGRSRRWRGGEPPREQADHRREPRVYVHARSAQSVTQGDQARRADEQVGRRLHVHRGQPPQLALAPQVLRETHEDELRAERLPVDLLEEAVQERRLGEQRRDQRQRLGELTQRGAREGVQILLDGRRARRRQVGIVTRHDAAEAAHEGGDEKLVLAGEVVVEDSVRHLGRAGDVAGRDRRDGTFGEQALGRVDEVVAESGGRVVADPALDSLGASR